MSHNTERSAAQALPAVIAQAEAAAHRGDPVRVADLARIAGVSVRTLYRTAARHLGGPPMAHLRRARLREVRRRLLTPAPAETVTSAATECGFFHLGRFAALYRREFGESPSETLRRGRFGGPPVLARRWRPTKGPWAASLEESRPA
jgi:transcriptional regulator GlxA family with amidase domain